MSLSEVALEALKAAKSGFSAVESDLFEDALARGLEAVDREGRLVGAHSAEELARLRVRVAELEKRLHDAAMTRTWRLENGKKFVYVEDIAPALLGLEPRPDAIARRIAPTQALRDLTVDGEHYALVHHVYRTPRDLPEPGGQR
jgi:hypothetical protein